MLCLIIDWNELIWLIYFGGYWKKTRPDISMHLYFTNQLDLVDSSSCVSVWVWSTAPCKLLLLVSSRSNMQLPQDVCAQVTKGPSTAAGIDRIPNVRMLLLPLHMAASCCRRCWWTYVQEDGAYAHFSGTDRVIEWTWIRSALKSKSPVALGSWSIGVSQSINKTRFLFSSIVHPSTGHALLRDWNIYSLLSCL
jgi:hypothetical protein